MRKKKSKLKRFLIAVSVLCCIIAVIVIPQKCSATVNSDMSVSALLKAEPLYVAHRGLSALHPQNTLPAFEAAKQSGYYGYEFDIHTTADGEWVVIHNDTVDAMTDGEGDVDSFTLKELLKLNIDAGNGLEQYADLKIPTLEETLDISKESDIIPVIEVKKCDIKYLPDFLEMLEERDLLDKAVLISFNIDYLTEIRRLNKDIKLMYLLNKVTKEDVDKCLESGFNGIDFNHKLFVLSVGALKYAKEKGLELGAWTVDNTISSDILNAFGVGLITSNRILP